MNIFLRIVHPAYCIHFTADKAQVGGMHPRLHGEMSRFKVIIKEPTPKIEIISDINTDNMHIVEESILKLTNDSLILSNDKGNTIYTR